MQVCDDVSSQNFPAVVGLQEISVPLITILFSASKNNYVSDLNVVFRATRSPQSQTEPSSQLKTSSVPKLLAKPGGSVP